jgi:hypothetical protein
MKTVIAVVPVSLVAGCSGISFRRDLERDPEESSFALRRAAEQDWNPYPNGP